MGSRIRQRNWYSLKDLWIQKYKKPKLRPAVVFSLFKDFNVVAFALKEIEKHTSCNSLIMQQDTVLPQW